MERTDRAALRQTFLQARTALAKDPAAHAAASARAQDNLMRLAVWQTARSVALYMPIRGEVSCARLAAAARAEGRCVLYPRCAREASGEKLLEFVVCPDENALRPGAFGILEPAGPAATRPPDLLVVPALALDRDGYRLGYGGGYYDRLLARPEWAKTPAAGLIFSFQLVKTLPRGAWDRPLGGLATEKDFLWL